MGIGMVGLMGASLFNYFWDRNYAKEDARAACRWVETHGGPRDCVLVLGVRPAFQYYEGTALRSEWLDFRNRNQLANNEAVLERWARECPRLWLVLGRSWEEDPLELAVPTLGKYFDRVEETALTGVRVLEFQPRNGSEPATRGGP